MELIVYLMELQYNEFYKWVVVFFFFFAIIIKRKLKVPFTIEGLWISWWYYNILKQIFGGKKFIYEEQLLVVRTINDILVLMMFNTLLLSNHLLYLYFLKIIFQFNQIVPQSHYVHIFKRLIIINLTKTFLLKKKKKLNQNLMWFI